VITAKILKALAAGAIIVSAVGVAVVAAAFSVHALLLPMMGEAGSAALVAAAFAILAALAAMVAVGRVEPRQTTPEPSPLIDLLLDLVRAKPLISSAVAALVGLILSRNPELLSTLIRTFTAAPPPPKDD
jgi:hypothetical protein